MSEPNKIADWPIAMAVALTLLLMIMGGYFGCYFAMSDLTPSLAAGDVGEQPGVVRFYDAKWKATIFRPAARVESVARGRRVDTLSLEGWQAFDAWRE